MTETLEILKAYNGTGYYGMLFIASLLYLYFTEEDTHTKKILVIVPTVIQILFLIPYFYMIYNKLDEGTYYRLLWLLPTTLVIAYTACKIIDTHTRLGVIVMAVILALSGTIVIASDSPSALGVISIFSISTFGLTPKSLHNQFAYSVASSSTML